MVRYLVAFLKVTCHSMAIADGDAVLTGKEFATEFQQAKVLKKLLKNIKKLLKNTEIMP